jgi:hypothetical protein
MCWMESPLEVAQHMNHLTETGFFCPGPQDCGGVIDTLPCVTSVTLLLLFSAMWALAPQEDWHLWMLRSQELVLWSHCMLDITAGFPSARMRKNQTQGGWENTGNVKPQLQVQIPPFWGSVMFTPWSVFHLKILILHEIEWDVSWQHHMSPPGSFIVHRGLRTIQWPTDPPPPCTSRNCHDPYIVLHHQGTSPQVPLTHLDQLCTAWSALLPIPCWGSPSSA